MCATSTETYTADLDGIIVLGQQVDEGRGVGTDQLITLKQQQWQKPGQHATFTQQHNENWRMGCGSQQNCLQAAALACLFHMTWRLVIQCSNKEYGQKIEGYCRLHRTASSYFCSHPALCSVSPIPFICAYSTPASSICSPQVFWLMRLLLSMFF